MKDTVDIIFVVSNKVSNHDMNLRIVQTTYSIIEPGLLFSASYNMITRLYSIFFRSCFTTPSIQNISASAVFALTEIICGGHHNKDLTTLMVDLLEFTIKEKKCQWIKELELKSITWDVILIAVKTIPVEEWGELSHSKPLVELLNEMYVIALENSFPEDPQVFPHDIFKNTIRL